jgi:serine/threonine protein kinase
MQLQDARPNDILDGRYRLVSRIGQGGFGDVWRAVELLPDGAAFRDVALKLLAPELAGTGWADEAKLLASFSHPALVTIFAAGILEKSGTPYVAMELLRGETLADRLKRRRRVSWRLALHFARDVAAALDVIHQKGVVHLDLKPANLFVTDEGAVKVLDFGISRREGALGARGGPLSARGAVDASLPTAVFLGDSDPYAATMAADGEGRKAVAGTPGFVAPEVLEMIEPTGAADAYALGATIVQLVTGRLPHAVSDEPTDWTNPDTVRSWWMELREATLRGRFRDLEEDGVPRGLAALVKRLLSVDPVARGCPPGSLASQLEEVWRRPFGVPSEPYPGLDPFGADREGTLFGRDADVARMLRDVTFEPRLVVQGARGVGKTSLVLSGLVPAMAKARLDDMEDWTAIVVDPTSVADERAIAERIAPGTTTLAEALSAERGGVGLAIVVDPLDAVVPATETDGRSEAPSLAAVAKLLEADLTKGIRVVACLDEEASARVLDRIPGDAQVRAALRYLGAPGTAEASEIALGPAKLLGAKIADADVVVRGVEDELRRDAPVLPFVSLALARMWREAETAKTELSGKRFAAQGGVDGAARDHADATLKDLPAAEQSVAIELLLALTATDGSLVERSTDEIVELAGGGAAPREVLEKLVANHLVRRKAGDARISTPALSTWPRLESARLAAMERLAFRERLRDAALAWERSGQRKEYVDRGALLADLAVHGGAAPHLSHVETDFVRASLRARRRRRVYLGTMALAVVACIAAVILGRRALEERRLEAEANERAAQRDAYVSGIVARARRSPDPFVKVAFLVEAVRSGAHEPSLGVEIFDAAEHLAPARVLTLAEVKDIEFPWGDRWIVGHGRAGSLFAIDLAPTKVEPDVVEDVDIDFDPASASALSRRPKVLEVMPHADPMVELAPFAFDTALATRSVSGEVRVIRLREDGSVSLAARPPIRCAGKLAVAERAPVIACTTESGLALWDMRDDRAYEEPFAASGLALSPDGRDVVAWAGPHTALWRPTAHASKRFDAARTVVLAAWSPKEPAVALVGSGGFEVVSLGGGAEPEPRVAVTTDGTFLEPTGVRWDRGGVDLAVCASYGATQWHYLRRGARDRDDPPPPSGGCVEHREGTPDRIADRDGFGPFATRSLGTHLSRGGFRLPKNRYLTRTLMMLSESDDSLDKLVSFAERTSDGKLREGKPHDSIVDVIRTGDSVAVERPSGIAVLGALDGVRKQSTDGRLLAACPSGKILAWRRATDGYEVFDVRSASSVAFVRRAPGLVVGVSPGCKRLYTEDLDGTLRASPLDGTGIEAVVAKLDGYAFDAKPAPDPAHPGLVVAISSGAVARIDEDTGVLRVLAYATPYATAIAAGPGPLEASYADATGISVVRASGAIDRVMEDPGSTVWQDIAPTHDGGSLVLAASDRISVLDLGRREVVLRSSHEGLTRFARWDEEGSLLAWSPDLEGVDRAVILPLGETAATQLGAVVSNLRVKDGRLVLKN